MLSLGARVRDGLGCRSRRNVFGHVSDFRIPGSPKDERAFLFGEVSAAFVPDAGAGGKFCYAIPGAGPVSWLLEGILRALGVRF